MFNYAAINKTPTIAQIKAIVNYIESNTKLKRLRDRMMGMKRPEPNKVVIDLNNAHKSDVFEITFDDQNKIISFNHTGSKIS